MAHGAAGLLRVGAMLVLLESVRRRLPGGEGVSACRFPSFRIAHEGLSQVPEDMQVIRGCRELAGLDYLGMERIGQHGFRCIL